MIAAVVFSRDRAMQLDLLLRSLQQNGRGAFRPVHVLWHATDSSHRDAYDTCAAEHSWATFEPEPASLVQRSLEVFAGADLACFFTDDDVLYRPPPVVIEPAGDVLCSSLRLGRNTTWCYPHDQAQPLPSGVRRRGLLVWYWRLAAGDFAYPGSLDGHVFSAERLVEALEGCPPYVNPNGIEDHLARWCRDRRPDLPPLMAANEQSSLVSLPLNRVNGTHPNRHGMKLGHRVADLNARYLAGERIDLDRLDFSDVRGAHQELELVFR